MNSFMALPLFTHAASTSSECSRNKARLAASSSPEVRSHVADPGMSWHGEPCPNRLFERGQVNDDIEATTSVVPEIRWDRLAQHRQRVLRLPVGSHELTANLARPEQSPRHPHLEPSDAADPGSESSGLYTTSHDAGMRAFSRTSDE